MAGRSTRGRQRIPIRQIQNQDDLYATFSKRRVGLFKKASELNVLCGADVGIIIFSPTNNPFSFFTPTMESVVERYRNPDQPLNYYTRLVEMHTRPIISNLNFQLDSLVDEKEHVKGREKQLDEIKESRPKGWWEEVPVENLCLEQVKEWKAYFQNFKAHVQNRIQEVHNGAGPSLSSAHPPGFHHTAVVQHPGGAPYGTSGGSEFPTILYYDAHALLPSPFAGNDHALIVPYYSPPRGQDLISRHVPMLPYFAFPPHQDPRNGNVTRSYLVPPPTGHFDRPYNGFMPPPYNGDGSGRDQAGPSGTQRDDDDA